MTGWLVLLLLSFLAVLVGNRMDSEEVGGRVICVGLVGLIACGGATLVAVVGIVIDGVVGVLT